MDVGAQTLNEIKISGHAVTVLTGEIYI